MTIVVIPLTNDREVTDEQDDIQIFPTSAQAMRYLEKVIKPKYHDALVLERETNFSYAHR